MEKYLEKIKPNVWEVCTTDELINEKAKKDQ